MPQTVSTLRAGADALAERAGALSAAGHHEAASALYQHSAGLYYQAAATLGAQLARTARRRRPWTGVRFAQVSSS
jgi:hypothetical protein